MESDLALLGSQGLTALLSGAEEQAGSACCLPNCVIEIWPKNRTKFVAYLEKLVK
jgi:hypothetical protein